MSNLTLVILLTLVSLVLQVIWIATDPRSWKERFEHNILRTYFVVVAIIIPQIVGAFYFPIPQVQYSTLIVSIGIILYTLGYILMLWSKFTMGEAWGPPSQHDIKRQPKLITTGPFSISRNPIYIGILLVTLEFSLAVQSTLFFLIIFLYLHFKNAIEKEETLLKKYFGKEYESYAKSVSRYISFTKLLRIFHRV